MPTTRWSRTRTLVGACLTAVLVATTLVATSSPAAAHTKLSPRGYCSGTELTPHRDAYGGAISVFISYSSANGGTNCVWAQKNLNRHLNEYMEVFIGECATGNPGYPCEPLNFARDPGYYNYYAGPRSITGTAGNCLLVYVKYRNLGEERWSGIHCG
ncbi:hypothetical protein WEI85_38690 [Actinomycetes bacterium KLBMP 9797]